MFGLILLVTSIVPYGEIAVVETVDAIELNHLFDEECRLVFDQVIFKDWSDRRRCFAVRDWRLIKKPSQIPQRDWQTDGYGILWFDGEVLREVRAKSLTESWSQSVDPEVEDRKVWPIELRRKLKHPRGAKQ